MRSWLIKIYRKPRSVILVLLIVSAWGITMIFHLNWTLVPRHDPSQLEVELQYSAGRNQEVLISLRESLDALPGIRECWLRHGGDKAKIFISLESAATLEEVQFLVQDVLNRFSEQNQDLRIGPASVSRYYDFPLLRIYLYPAKGSADISRLSQLARDYVIPRIVQVEGVGEVKLTGQAENAVFIVPDYRRMKLYGYTTANLRDAISACSQTHIFEFRDGSRSVIEVPHDGSQVRNCQLSSRHLVSEVCDLKDSLVFPAGRYDVKGNTAVAIDVFPGFNATSVLDLANELRELTAKLADERSGLEFHFSDEQDMLVRENISQLIVSLILVVLANILVVYSFTRDGWRTLLIAATIPLTLIIAMGVLQVFRVDVHLFVLLGIILGIGLLIDTPIVVTEAFRNLNAAKGKIHEQVIKRLFEVSSPVIMSTLTTILSFIPVIFLSDRTRQLFLDQFLTLTTMLVISLIIGLVLLPLFYVYTSTRNKEPGNIPGLLWYEHLMSSVMRSPGLIAVSGIAFVIFSIIVLQKMDSRVLPSLSFKQWRLEQPTNGRGDADMAELYRNAQAVYTDQNSKTVHLNLPAAENLDKYELNESNKLYPAPNAIVSLFPSEFNTQDLRLYPGNDKNWEMLARMNFVQTDTIWSVLPNELQWYLARPSNPKGEVKNIGNYEILNNQQEVRLLSRMGDLHPDRISSVIPEIRIKEKWNDRFGEFIPVRFNQGESEFVQKIGMPLRRVLTEGEINMVNSQTILSVIIIASIVYLMLAFQFESWTWPLLVLVAIPLSIAGSIIALWMTELPMNVISLVGIVVTLGISVNDAILKVSSVRSFLAVGLSLKHAVKMASKERFMPVVMTSLTTLAACLPMFFFRGAGNEIQQAMGITVIGGLCASTLGALILIPAMIKLAGLSDHTSD